MERSRFIRQVGALSSALVCVPNLIIGAEDKPEAYQKDVVQQFVGAGHSDLEKVKSLLAEFPNLIYSSHDWGNGDFETAIDAGGHVGFDEMVNFLMDKGARPTIHALTMLGKKDLVLPFLKAYPNMIHTLGPHGFTLLHHAQKGGERSLDLLNYFDEMGLNVAQVSIK